MLSTYLHLRCTCGPPKKEISSFHRGYLFPLVNTTYIFTTPPHTHNLNPHAFSVTSYSSSSFLYTSFQTQRKKNLKMMFYAYSSPTRIVTSWTYLNLGKRLWVCSKNGSNYSYQMV